MDDIGTANQERVKSDIGILYGITESDRSNFSVRVKLSPSILFRYRYEWPLTDTFTTRFTQEWYRRDNANGIASRIDFEKIIDSNLFLRQSNSVAQSESYDGKEWESSLVLYHRLSDKKALSYESSITGVTLPDKYTTNERLGVRYRHNFLRKWLFYEVVPAVNWNRELFIDERSTDWEILFRLEVNFVNL